MVINKFFALATSSDPRYASSWVISCRCKGGACEDFDNKFFGGGNGGVDGPVVDSRGSSANL